MSGLSVNIQQRFTNLRKKLDQLGYMQPLTIDCLPLVENLFTDFLWTTDSFRKCKMELDKRMDIRDKLEDYIEPYKKDNGRQLNENNRLQTKIIEIKMQNDEKMRDLQCQLRHMEEEKEDLKIFNTQCLDKLKKYEVEAKLMVDKIMQLQEKNFQAVVHIPEGKRKQIPFRRQRMDIDFLIPRMESCESGTNVNDDNETVCSDNRDRAKSLTQQSDSYSSEKADLLESVTNKCQELTSQLKCATEELELNDRKIENYSEQVRLYEEEIQRLSRELSGGRTIEALTLECEQKSRDRVYEQLSMQMDLLQQRNEELEKEVIRCNALNIKEGKYDGHAHHDNTQTMETQKLIDRIDELVKREKCLLKELHGANCRLSQRKTDCIPTIAGSLQYEIDGLQHHIESLESDRNYWRKEAEAAYHDKKDNNRESGSYHLEQKGSKEYQRKSLKKSDELVEDLSSSINEIDDLKNELKHCRHRLKDITGENDELKQVISLQQRNMSPPVKDKDHSRQSEAELKKVKAERDSLQDLLDKFERQLHDIQGNIRVLTQERDMICERYEECQRELHDMRETIIQLEKPRKDHNLTSHQQSLTTQSMFRRLEMERDDSINDLHKMTTERDSLRERLKTVTETAISEKARICQKLEDCEVMRCQLAEEKEELGERCSILRNKIGELEERNHQLGIKNESLTNVIEKERKKMQKLNSDLHSCQNEIQRKERKESQLSEELRLTEHRISTLQETVESQNMEAMDIKTESIKLKEIIGELDSEKDQMQSELDERIEQLKNTEMQLRVKEDALNEIRINVSSLEQQLRRINEVNNHRDQELRALVVHNEQLENDMRHQVSRYDQVKSENTRLEEDLMCLTREHHKLESEFRDSQRCLMEITEEKDQMELKMSHFQQMGCEQKDQNQELLEQYRNLSIENDRMQLALQKMEDSSEELRTEIDARENMVSRMREQLSQAEREINSAHSKIHNLEDQIRNMNQVIESNGHVTESHSVEKHEILQELAAMRDLCARLESSKENAQRQLSSRLLEYEQLKAENSGFYKENENLREEIEYLHENIRNMETVLSVGREKEFMNGFEAQQRIVELETENEHLAQLPMKIEQLQHELKKYSMENTELEAECEKFRRQLTSEKFKLELVNQELRRRHKPCNDGSLTDRGVYTSEIRDSSLLSDRPNEFEYFSSSSGVHTGRSLYSHTPTLPVVNNLPVTSEHSTRVAANSPDEIPNSSDNSALVP